LTADTLNYFSTASFSTLYTSIPHASLKHALEALIKDAYKVRDNTFLIADTTGKAHWSDVPSRASYRFSVTEETLIAYVEYLVDKV
jgi:hypothetical protein